MNEYPLIGNSAIKPTDLHAAPYLLGYAHGYEDAEREREVLRRMQDDATAWMTEAELQALLDEADEPEA